MEKRLWRKPPGRSATLQCDIAPVGYPQDGATERQGRGDDIAIEGGAAIDADNRLREFDFPDFAQRHQRMEVQGTLGKDDVWRVKASGPTFDGTRLLPFAVPLGQLAEQRPKAQKTPREGLDLGARSGP